MQRPQTVDQDTPDYTILYDALQRAESADVMATVQEVLRQTDAIRELTEAIEEIDSWYIPTFMSA